MANRDDILNNRITMGRVRHQCYVLYVVRRRREEEMEERRPGINPLIGRGIRPMVPRFNHWEKDLGKNNYGYAA